MLNNTQRNYITAAFGYIIDAIADKYQQDANKAILALNCMLDEDLYRKNRLDLMADGGYRLRLMDSHQTSDALTTEVMEKEGALILVFGNENKKVTLGFSSPDGYQEKVITNENQRNLILKIIFGKTSTTDICVDDIDANELSKMLSLIKGHTHDAICDIIDQARKLYNHPHPQNKSTGSPYLNYGEDGIDPNTNEVVYEPNGHGMGMLREPRGLLGLSAKNDNTTENVTRSDVIQFINEAVQTEIDVQTRLLVIEEKYKELIEKLSAQPITLPAPHLRTDENLSRNLEQRIKDVTNRLEGAEESSSHEQTCPSVVFKLIRNVNNLQTVLQTLSDHKRYELLTRSPLSSSDNNCFEFFSRRPPRPDDNDEANDDAFDTTHRLNPSL